MFLMNSVRHKPKTMFVSSHRPKFHELHICWRDSNVSKLYYFAVVDLQVPKNTLGNKVLEYYPTCYLPNNVKNHSNMSKKIKSWKMARLNRLNCVVHIRHLVRVPGTRSSRKTFGVYPSTFSALEDHRAHSCSVVRGNTLFYFHICRCALILPWTPDHFGSGYQASKNSSDN